mgnify:CR=1 FL=1
MLSHTQLETNTARVTDKAELETNTLSARQSGEEEEEEENNEAQGKDLPKRIILMGEGRGTRGKA